MTEAQRCAECDCENGGLECTWFKPGPNATSAKSEDVEALAPLIMKALNWCDEMAGDGFEVPELVMFDMWQALGEPDGESCGPVIADTLRALLAERDALREALTFYAPDGDAWKDLMPEPPTQEEIDTFGGNIIDVGMPEVLYDRGERAGAALGMNQ